MKRRLAFGCWVVVLVVFAIRATATNETRLARVRQCMQAQVEPWKTRFVAGAGHAWHHGEEFVTSARYEASRACAAVQARLLGAAGREQRQGSEAVLPPPTSVAEDEIELPEGESERAG
jgi:hypothetical protein